jgi:FkbM family methyltransferase
LRLIGKLAALRIVGLLLALYAIGTDWLTSWHDMGFAGRGLLDEPAHLATALIALGAITRVHGRLPDPRFCWAMLVCSVAIDVDHIPEQLGIWALTEGTPRPYTHALWTVLVLAAASLICRRLSRRPAALVLGGAAAGLAAHFLRDIATAPMAFWLPVSEDSVQVAYFWYVLAMAALIAIPPVPSGFRLGNALTSYRVHVTAFGRVRGSWLLLASRLSPAFRGRPMTVPVPMPGTEASVTVRLGTSDVDVYAGVFMAGKYAWKFAEPPKVIVDAGAYIGLSAVYFAIRYPDAVIIAIEPGADNFELLAKNTAGFPNIRLVRAALWTDSGEISLSDPGEGAWGLRVAAPGSPGHAPVEDLVRAVTVDEIRAEQGLDKIDLLKMDIEGTERELFAAAESWLPAVRAIHIELHDRVKDGCSAAFFTAVSEFRVERHRGETVLVTRVDPQPDSVCALPLPAGRGTPAWDGDHDAVTTCDRDSDGDHGQHRLDLKLPDGVPVLQPQGHH